MVSRVFPGERLMATMVGNTDTCYTFVLVHGGFHGGWCWRRVAQRLRAAGHEVYTPTQTGLGERAHLLDDTVGVETFVQDIVSVLENEELTNVILVGHSLGGISVTGTADRVPDRIARLVYIDALIVDNGRTGFDDMDPAIVEERLRQADEFSDGIVMAPFAANHFGITDPSDAAWLTRRMTPQPLRIYRDTVYLDNPIGNGIPGAYIASTKPWYKPTESTREWVHNNRDWGWDELPTGHDSMIIAPELVTATLLSAASRHVGASVT